MADEIFHVVWAVPSGKWTVKKPFVGSWRITELQGYDDDYVNLCGPAKLKISSRGSGHMNFGAVEAELDCKMDDLDERVLRFTFEGGDEGDQMVGRVFRHLSDEFGFKAKRSTKEKTA